MHCFPQLATVVQRYLDQKVRPIAPAKEVDAFLSPWYGWLLERLLEAIHEELGDGEVAESPRYETNRGPGSTEEVDFETRREPYPVTKSHVNAVVPDTAKWEQSAAYQIDRNKHVKSFVKNAGLGFAIPYLHNGEHHEYIPDFIIQLTGPEPRYLILETKGYDPLSRSKGAGGQTLGPRSERHGDLRPMGVRHGHRCRYGRRTDFARCNNRGSVIDIAVCFAQPHPYARMAVVPNICSRRYCRTTEPASGVTPYQQVSGHFGGNRPLRQPAPMA